MKIIHPHLLNTRDVSNLNGVYFMACADQLAAIRDNALKRQFDLMDDVEPIMEEFAEAIDWVATLRRGDL